MSHDIYSAVRGLFMQGEVGEPGQKGSKADKGEQVSFRVPCPMLICFFPFQRQ